MSRDPGSALMYCVVLCCVIIRESQGSASASQVDVFICNAGLKSEGSLLRWSSSHMALGSAGVKRRLIPARICGVNMYLVI